MSIKQHIEAGHSEPQEVKITCYLLISDQGSFCSIPFDSRARAEDWALKTGNNWQIVEMTGTYAGNTAHDQVGGSGKGAVGAEARKRER